MRTSYVNVIFVLPGIPAHVRGCKSFPYPDEMTPSELADEIAEWIRSLDDR